MKRKWKLSVLTCITLFLSGSSCIAQSNGNQDQALFKKDIEKNNALYFELYAKNDDNIVNLYTEDGCLMVPNEPAKCGKAALLKDFRETYAAGKIRGVKFTTLAIYGNGEGLITEDGTWQVLNKQGTVIDDGKYLKLWKRTEDGWKIFKDIFNSNHSGQ